MTRNRLSHLIDVEDDPLALSQCTEDAPLEGFGVESNLSSIGVRDDDAEPGCRIEEFDDTLHDG